MNKRQKKKFKKKYKHKSYRNVRLAFLVRVSGMSEMKANDSHGFNMLYIVDSKRMNLKHPKKVSLLRNAYPTSLDCTQDLSCSGNLDISFNAPKFLKDNDEQVATQIENYFHWLDGIRRDNL